MKTVCLVIGFFISSSFCFSQNKKELLTNISDLNETKKSLEIKRDYLTKLLIEVNAENENLKKELISLDEDVSFLSRKKDSLYSVKQNYNEKIKARDINSFFDTEKIKKQREKKISLENKFQNDSLRIVKERDLFLEALECFESKNLKSTVVINKQDIGEKPIEFDLKIVSNCHEINKVYGDYLITSLKILPKGIGLMMHYRYPAKRRYKEEKAMTYKISSFDNNNKMFILDVYSAESHELRSSFAFVEIGDSNQVVIDIINDKIFIIQ